MLQDESCIAGHLGERAAREDATDELLQPEQGEQKGQAPAASSSAVHEEQAAPLGVVGEESNEASGVAPRAEGEEHPQGMPFDREDGKGSGSSGGSSGGSSDSGSASEQGHTATADSASHSRCCHKLLLTFASTDFGRQTPYNRQVKDQCERVYWCWQE